MSRVVTDADHPPDRQLVLAGELEVAGVMSRHPHDRARAIAGQHVVGDPDWNSLFGEGVDRIGAGKDAGLLVLRRKALDFRFRFGALDVGVHRSPLVWRHDFLKNLVLGRHHHEGRAEDGIGPGGEDAQLPVPLNEEVQIGALAAPNPVGLHQLDPLRPAVELAEIVEEALGIGGDLEEPLLQLLLCRLGAAAPAHAVDDLLVGEHGVVFGTPIDRGLLFVGEPTFEELQEQPLGPAVVIVIAGRHLAVPGVEHPHQVELMLRDRDVVLNRHPRRDATLDRRVLRRQAERVPAEGIEHVEAAHHLVAGEGIADHVVAEVPHVQRPGGVGEHHEVVELRLAPVVRHSKQAGLLPGVAPLGLDCLRIVDGCDSPGHGTK